MALPHSWAPPTTTSNDIIVWHNLSTCFHIGDNVRWYSGKGVCILIWVSRSLLHCEWKVCQLRYPSMASGFQFGCWEYICKQAVIGIDYKVRCMVKVVSEMFTNSPLQSQELKFPWMEIVVRFCFWMWSWAITNNTHLVSGAKPLKSLLSTKGWLKSGYPRIGGFTRQFNSSSRAFWCHSSQTTSWWDSSMVERTLTLLHRFGFIPQCCCNNWKCGWAILAKSWMYWQYSCNTLEDPVAFLLHQLS